MSVLNPPLCGDGHGNYRIHLVGNSGTGKTTLGTYLSTKLNVPRISLDEIAWQPGWQKTKEDEFKKKVSALMAQDTRGWIIDGDYRALGTLVPDSATDIIWLDPPLRHYLPHILWRTFMRLLDLSPPCAEGCKETWGEVFSNKGIVWFCISHHSTAKTKYKAWFSRLDLQGGAKMIRLDESCGELTTWKNEVEEHCRQT